MPKFFEPGGTGSMILDPGGIFHEGGFLGWDLFGVDHRSEDALAAAKAKAEKDIKDAEKKQEEALNNLKNYLVIGLIIVAIYYGFKIYQKKWKKM